MKNTLTAAVLLIGNELLSGRVQDLNVSHIATTLEPRGIRVREVRIVPDEEVEIIRALNYMRKTFDYVFTTVALAQHMTTLPQTVLPKPLTLKILFMRRRWRH